MTDFLKTPYVPERKVRLALIGHESEPFRALLRDCGVETIVLPPSQTNDPAVKNHADLSVFHAGCGEFFCSENAAGVVRAFQPEQLTVVPVGKQYPFDCALNIAWLRNHAFGLGQGSGSAVGACLQSRGVRWHTVRQGYANCSVCQIGENSLITDDPSVYAAAIAAGLEALLVQKGDVRLNGHDYGFIGGASAMIGPGEAVFFGDLSKHRDLALIKAFLQSHGCICHDLTDIPLTDIGGIVAIK